MESYMADVCYHLSLEAVERGSQPGSTVYNGVANRDKLVEMLEDPQRRRKVLDVFERRWKVNQFGDFVMLSGSLIVMDIKLHEKKSTITILVHNNYEQIGKGDHTHSSSKDVALF